MQCYAVPRNTALLISLKNVPENLVSESVEEKVKFSVQSKSYKKYNHQGE